MKKNIILLVFMFCFLGFGFSQDKIITAIADPWAPFVDPDNSTDGLSLEIIRAAYKTQGFSVTMKYVPWARALDSVKNGEYDILPGVWYSKERAEYLYFSNHYTSNNIIFASNISDSFEYSGLDSLTGKTVGIIRGYGYSENFMNADNFNREPTNTLLSNILKLVNHRVDYIIEDEIVLKTKILKEKPELLNQIFFSKTSLLKNELFIASGLNNPRHEEIVNMFNKGLEEIRSNGTYKEIMDKYTGVQK